MTTEIHTTPLANDPKAQVDLLKELLKAAEAHAAEVAALESESTKFQVDAEFVEVPQAVVNDLIAGYKAADKMMKAAKDELAAAKQAIIEKMGHAEVLVVEETGQHVVSHQVVEAMILDTAKLKKEQPEVTAKYMKPRVSRPFKVLI